MVKLPYSKSNVDDSWSSLSESQKPRGLGIPRESEPITLQEIAKLTEKQRQRQRALDEMRKAAITIQQINAELADDADFAEEFDEKFDKLQETVEKRIERLHKTDKGQTMEVPPEVEEIRKTG